MMLRKFRMVRLLVMVLLTSPYFLFGQNRILIDSLKFELREQKSDTAKIRLLLAIADNYSSSDSNSAFKYIALAKKISKLNDYQKENADIFFQEGNILFSSGDFQKAILKFENALSIYKNLKMEEKIADCYSNIGGVYGQTSKYSKALSYFSKAMDIHRLLKNNNGISRCYLLIAIIYNEQKQYDTAIDYAKNSIKLTDKNNKTKLAKLYLNLFIFYYDKGEYTKSLSLVDSIFPALKDSYDYCSLSKAYINLGNLYRDISEFENAKKSFLNSIFYNSKLGNINDEILVNINLARVYSKTNQTDSAINILKKTLYLNNQLKSIKFYEVLYYDLYELYEKRDSSKLALGYYKKYIIASDSILADLNNKQIVEIQTRFEVDLKNEKIKLLTKNEQLSKQKVLTLGISLLTVVIAGLLFISYKNRKAKEKKLMYEAELKESSYKHAAESKESAYKMEIKQRELTHKAMHISQQEKNLSQIKKQLENIRSENSKTKETLMTVLSGINQQLKQNTMEDFEKYFIEVHPEFFTNLKQKYNNLTQNDLKICALIKLTLNIKQIADITRKTTRSVENSRSLIRKKMGLSLEENLFEAISQH